MVKSDSTDGARKSAVENSANPRDLADNLLINVCDEIGRPIAQSKAVCELIKIYVQHAPHVIDENDPTIPNALWIVTDALNEVLSIVNSIREANRELLLGAERK